MRILVACEFSGIVRSAFRKRGHDAWSNDLLGAADGSPHHIQADVLTVLNDGWDLMIAHPPCTDLAVSGAHRFREKIADGRQQRALDFVRRLLDAPIPRIALENPVGVISSKIRKPDQIIQPYEFGHDASKKTCLWLKDLPKLVPTRLIEGRYACADKHVWASPRASCPECGNMYKRRVWGNQTPSGQNKLGPSEDRWAKRSYTYPGIAEAMAEQWGRL